MYKPCPGAEILPVPDSVQAMFDWSASKGARWPKIVYPVRFPPGYIGSMAIDSISPGESLVTAPNSALLTTKVASSSDLKPIFESKAEVFDPSSPYYDDLVLSTFLISEKYKGNESEWAAFIGYQPKHPSNTQDWTREELEELQDPDLIFDTTKSLETHLEAWNKWKTALATHTERFSEEMLALSEYTWAIRLIGTRTFGKFAPYVTFFPVGELLNHDNVETFYTYLPPQGVADCTKRYAGVVNDEDHDGWIYEVNPTIELSNDALAILAYLLNEGLPEDVIISLKARCSVLDEKEAEEEAKRKVYRPADIDLTETDEKEMRIVAGPHEFYEKGAEVYMSYGRYSNRQLLSVYGFSLRSNHFNFAVLKTQVKFLVEDLEASERLRIEDFSPDHFVKFKLKEKVICKELIKTLRKLWWKAGSPTEAFFEPKLVELEVSILRHAVGLLNQSLNSYPTSYQEDLGLLQGDLALRKYFAVRFI